MQTMKNLKTIYLVDGTAYIYRAFHAIRRLSNSHGLPTNAVYGFTQMLLKLIEDKKPEYLVMCFDAKGPTFRHEIYGEYKANRPPMPDDLSLQVPLIKQIVQGFNLPVFEMPGYEADDLIGTLARKAEEHGFSVVMVTGDKDFMQLVTPKTRIWDPMKDNVIDLAHIEKTFQVNPLQMIEVMGLSGDQADNVPGVPGVGQKTALKLIHAYGTLDGLYQKIDDIKAKKQKENLVNYKEQAYLSRDLVTIKTDLDISFDSNEFKARTPDDKLLGKLYKEFEFNRLLKSVPRKTDLKHKDYKAIQNLKDLNGLVSILEKSTIFALDTETTSVNPMLADLVGLSFSVKKDQAFYIPCGHDYPDMPDQLEMKAVLERLRPVLEDSGVKKVGQNIKYDWMVLLRHGVNLDGVVFDTMLASYLLNPSKRAHSLDRIALDFLDHQTITYDEVAGKGKAALNFSEVDIEKATPYACEDADITLMAKEVIEPKIDSLGLSPLFHDVEMPLVPVLMRMEMKGICVDRERLLGLSETFERELKGLESLIYDSAGEEFNINSSKQLGTILFEKLKLPIQKKTRKKTGYSTDMSVLTTLSRQHELPALILKHRTLAKLKSTYSDALLELINPATGRIHTSFNQTIAATGRLSSSDPNLQNIPIRTEEGKKIRQTFIPQKGWYLVSADYSQVELRILAHCSEDPILIQAFKNDEDIHARTAAEVFQVFPEMITSDLRRQAKAINFGIIYGMSPYGLSRQLEINQKTAKTYIDNYFSRYKGVRQYMETIVREAEKTGQTSTLMGRIRLLPDINHSNRTVRQFAERTAINTPIQGTAADLIKLAMIQVDAAFRDNKLKAAMLLSVHDELIFEAPPEELDTVADMVRDIMEGVWELKVPLKVNVSWGGNWAQAH